MPGGPWRHREARRVANGTAKISNELYRAPLNRIRLCLRELSQHSFDQKAGYLDPVDWRPREYNKAADHVANCGLAERRIVDTIDQRSMFQHLTDAIGLQVFCDGGFAGSAGAAAMVLYAIFPNRRSLLGATVIYVEQARCSFHMEVTALDIATAFLKQKFDP